MGAQSIQTAKLCFNAYYQEILDFLPILTTFPEIFVLFSFI